jgi:PAS domain S-box-containing protein
LSTSERTYRVGRIWQLLLAVLILLGLYFASLRDYLLFHSFAELVTVAIAGCAFIIAWNARRLYTHTYLLVVGLGLGAVAILAMFHMLAYKGMHVFFQDGANLPTQLWVASRGLLALTLLAAPLLMHRRLHAESVLALYSIVTGLLLCAIFWWHIFPTAYMDPDRGLTDFKIAAEYLICGVLLISLILLSFERAFFDCDVFSYLIAATVLTIFAEIAFTSYISVYSPANILGHLFMVTSYYCFYLAIVQTGFTKPVQLLFRDLKMREEEQDILLEELRVSHEETQQRADELQERETRLSTFAAATFEGIILSKDGYIVDCNEQFARMAGQPISKLKGVLIADLIPPEDRERIAENIQLQRESVVEHAFIRADGTRLIVEAHGKPLPHFPGMRLSAVRDITERKRSEEALLAAERARAEMAENINREISHRTKNNLAMVASLVELSSVQQDDPKTTQLLRDIQSRIMAFASLHSELQTAATENTVDIFAVIQRICETIESAFATEVAISLSGESNLVPAKAATNLALVANELITNAAKYGRKTNSSIAVRVSITQSEEILLLSVWNSGADLPADFDPTTQRGLGLHLVHDFIVSLYKGAFSLTLSEGGTLARVEVSKDKLG